MNLNIFIIMYDIVLIYAATFNFEQLYNPENRVGLHQLLEFIFDVKFPNFLNNKL